MLIRFLVENFMSFNERQCISFLPGKGVLKNDHKTQKISGISVLKTGVIFGANASGKSNIIKAIDFGKQLVLNSTKPDGIINYKKFKLDKKSVLNDTRFEYEIQHKGKNYAYGFIFNNEVIKEEWLYEIGIKKELKIFERNNDNNPTFDLDNILKKVINDEEKQFLRFIAKGTPNNQLFLNEIITRKVKENVSNIDDLFNVIDWFKNSLKIIFPDSKYNFGLKFELKHNEELKKTFEEFLSYFDTGINGVCFEKVENESVDIPPKLLAIIKEDLFSSKSDKFKGSLISNKNSAYFITVKDNDLIVEKFMTKHNIIGSNEKEQFDTSEESDGTNRIIDFIPLLMDLLNGDKVFIIDEMERSLHPNLIYDLIDLFLSKSKNANSQLILASHESTLLTQKLLRKDEIWFVLKDNNGSSSFHSLEEYKIRFDKEIRKNYLLGRFKAVPRIGNRNILTVLKNL